MFRETITVYCESHKQVRQYTVSAAAVRELRPYATTVRNPVPVEHQTLLRLSPFFFFFWAYLKWPSWVQGGNYRQQTELPWERIPPLETEAAAWTRNCACSGHRRTRSSPLQRWRASVVNTAQLKLIHTSDPGAFCVLNTGTSFNPLNAELNPICHLLALLEDHHILHISRIRVKSVQSFCYGTWRRQVERCFVMNTQESQFNSSRVQISMGKAKSNFRDWS